MEGVLLIGLSGACWDWKEIRPHVAGNCVCMGAAQNGISQTHYVLVAVMLES